MLCACFKSGKRWEKWLLKFCNRKKGTICSLWELDIHAFQLKTMANTPLDAPTEFIPAIDERPAGRWMEGYLKPPWSFWGITACCLRSIWNEL
jgi:hypothetical protein